MKKQTMTLAGIPAILYGSRSRNVYLYFHGKNGCKEEAERFAATACEAGWQVLAIDLPEHGARKNSPERLLPWVAVTLPAPTLGSWFGSPTRTTRVC